jgi:lysozyme
MKASDTIIKRIKEFEGFSAKPYRDSAGVLTIGYGTTKDADKYTNISKAQADLLLRRDLAAFEDQLNNYIAARGYELTQNQFDALVSFIYNVGSIKPNSGLDKALRSGRPKVVAANLQRYVYAGGQKLAGLVKRRNYEAMLFATAPADIGKALLAALGLLQF